MSPPRREGTAAPAAVPLRGRWRDTVTDGEGRTAPRGPWRCNTIVDGCWPLLAALLKGERGMGGIQYWAVGAGDPAWDRAPAVSDPRATALRDEVARVPVERGDISFLDASGRPVTGPTPRLEVRAGFALGEAVTLREFGIFGGDATEEPGSGRLVNYVAHPRLELAPRARLDRRLRFSFYRDAPPVGTGPAAHWLGGEELAVVDGIGKATAESLAEAGVRTVEDLARAEPLDLEGVATLATRVQLRARARLLLRVAGEMRPAGGFLERTAWDVLVTPTATLAADAGASEDEAALLREQVGALELALDSRWLKNRTVGELARPLPGALVPDDS